MGYPLTFIGYVRLSLMVLALLLGLLAATTSLSFGSAVNLMASYILATNDYVDDERWVGDWVEQGLGKMHRLWCFDN